MPMTKEEKNARARARREAAKAAKQTETAAVDTPEVTDAEPISVESAIVNAGTQPHDGGFIETDPAEIARQRETLVLKLIDAQVGTDGGENASILGMVEACRTGADPTEFLQAYAALAQSRMSPDTVKSRKSNLKGVLTFAMESQDYVLKISPQKDDSGDTIPSTVLGLQAMYKLRQVMLKGPDNGEAKPKRAKAAPEDDIDDIESSMSPTDLLMHQINLSIDAAVNAGFPGIAEKLRVVYHAAYAAVVSTEAESEDPALV